MRTSLSENGEICITSSYLASFAEAKMRKETIPFFPCAEPGGEPDIFTEPRTRLICEGEIFIVSAEADAIYCDGGRWTVEKTRRLGRISSRSGPFSDARFLADALVSAYAVCKTKNLGEIDLVLTLRNEESSKSFRATLSAAYLSSITEGLVSRSVQFAKAEKEFLSEGLKDIEKMRFPFSEIREGQRDLIKSVYKCCAKGKRLIAVAPTGIGKTVSVLYPAIKAVGGGFAEKIFYLTAKGVTGKAALDTVRLLAGQVGSLRAVSVIAKDRICPSNDKKDPFSVKKCTRDCPLLSDISGESYEKRERMALCELLSCGRIYEKNDIKTIAAKHRVCPYELSLDISEYCTVIVCDYNYVFDSKVKLRRYFTENKTKYVLLADEAHNLVDRTREMYSAKISSSEIKKLADALASKPETSDISKCLDDALGAFDKIRALCRENSSVSSSGELYGYSIEDHVPSGVTGAFEKLKTALARLADKSDDEDVLLQAEALTPELSSFVNCAALFDEHFVLFSEVTGENAVTRIMCLDPSSILDKCMRGAVCSVMFSATLTPTEYFADILGCSDAEILELDSPFDEDNLCLAAIDTVSTKYSLRSSSVSDIAEIILTTVCAKSGNYIVYCPSYKYMNTVVKAFLEVAPREFKVAMQKRDMSLESGRKFLSFFEKEHGEDETLVGFCVMGGMFSEGIDLPSDRLIGTVLVGIGLPGLSSELNVMRDYFDRTREDGYNFAYLYPAMIKILQAAGRVIRSENDRGVAVLIDDRYRDPNVRRLFPSHWRKMHYIGDTYSLSKYLSDFWNK